MRSPSMWAGKRRLRLRELLELALLCALMFAFKEAMAVLPNIHPVLLLILLGVRVYGWRILYSVFGFVLLEIGVYGAGLWTLVYLYIWPLAAVLALPFRQNGSRLFWAAFAGVFGLCFGALCAIPYFFMGGWPMALSYWVAGIPFDLIHCVSNAVLVFILLPPLFRLVMRLKNRS